MKTKLQDIWSKVIENRNASQVSEKQTNVKRIQGKIKNK